MLVIKERLLNEIEKLDENEINHDKFTELRKSVIKKVWDKFHKWLLKKSYVITPSSDAGKSINYTLNCWDKILIYLNEWYLTPDNNMAENAIRPFVIGRKAWLFSYSPKGAEANALFYSLVESVKANGLNLFDYFKYLFIKLPKAISKEELIQLLPSELTNEQLRDFLKK